MPLLPASLSIDNHPVELWAICLTTQQLPFKLLSLPILLFCLQACGPAGSLVI